MIAGEGDMVCGVPVFGADFEREGEAEEAIDCGDYGAAIGDGEGAVLCQCPVIPVDFGGEGEWRGIVGLRVGKNLLVRPLLSGRV